MYFPTSWIFTLPDHYICLFTLLYLIKYIIIIILLHCYYYIIITLCAYEQQGYVFGCVGLCTYICTYVRKYVYIHYMLTKKQAV